MGKQRKLSGKTALFACQRISIMRKLLPDPTAAPVAINSFISFLGISQEKSKSFNDNNNRCSMDNNNNNNRCNMLCYFCAFAAAFRPFALQM